MKSIDEMVEELKASVLNSGMEAMDDVLGFECQHYDKDTIDNLLDEILDQMPDEDIETLYNKYCTH